MPLLPEIEPVTVHGNVLTSPFPDVNLFFTRYGITFEDLVEAHVQWTVRTLIPFLNDQVETIDAGRQANLDALQAAVNSALASQATSVNAAVEDALQQVINSTILVTDPVTDAIILNATTATRLHLNNLYGLSDEKLLPFFNNASSGNANAQVRALLDQMYKVTNGKILDILTAGGALADWLDNRYAVTTNAYWTPNWGGDNGARLGDSGLSEGSWQTNDGKVLADCRLVFGSTAIFGGSVLTGVNGSGGIDPRWTFGEGLYIPFNNGPTRDLRLQAINNSEMRVLIDAGAGWVPIGAAGMGNPTQQSQMILHVHGNNPL